MASIIALLLVIGLAALYNAVQDRFVDNADCAAQAFEDVGC
jgi:hypothetical protein